MFLRPARPLSCREEGVRRSGERRGRVLWEGTGLRDQRTGRSRLRCRKETVQWKILHEDRHPRARSEDLLWQVQAVHRRAGVPRAVVQVIAGPGLRRDRSAWRLVSVLVVEGERLRDE